MAKFWTIPVEVEAIQWNGSQDDDAVAAFAGHWFSPGVPQSITTFTISVRVSPGDWIVRQPNGEYLPFDSAGFAATYQPQSPPHNPMIGFDPDSFPLK